MYPFRYLRFLCASLLALLTFVSCDPYRGIEKEDTIHRTVLVYIVAENSLCYGDFHKLDMAELDAAVGDIPKNGRLLVYVDDDNYPYLYQLQADKQGNPVHKMLVQYEEDRVSTSNEQLAEVMTKMTTLFPSDEYGFVYWSHGSAWLPASRSIGIDNGKNSYSNTGSKMEIDDLAAVLGQFPKLEFLMFDACFMQAMEVDWALRNCAKYIIASPAEIPGPGAPYDRLMTPMFAESCDVEGIIEQYYRSYADSAVSVGDGSSKCFGALLSVVKTDELDSLRAVTERMLEKYVQAYTYDDLSDVQYYNPISSSSRPEYFDMNGYMQHLITSSLDYMRWHNAFEKAVPYTRTTRSWYSSYSNAMEYVNRTDYGGVSMFVPQSIKLYNDLLGSFRNTSWYQDCWFQTGW